MSRRTFLTPSLAIALGLLFGVAAVAQKPKVEPKPEPQTAPKPKTDVKPESALPAIRVSKKTTFVLGPLREDGGVDFAAAINERISKGVAPENNAAVLIAQVAARSELSPEYQAVLYEKLGIPKTVKPRRRWLSPREFVKHAAGEDDGPFFDSLIKQQQDGSQRIWSRKEMPELAAWLEHNREPLAVVRKAVKRPRWYSPVVLPRRHSPVVLFGTGEESQVLMWNPMPLIHSSREFGRGLAATATLAVREGRNEEAVAVLLDCHRLARLVAEGKGVMELVYGFAIEGFAAEAEIAILNSGKLNAKELLQLQNGLKALPPMPSCTGKIDFYERLVLIDAVIHIRRGGFPTLKLLTDLSDLDDWIGRFTWAIYASLVDWNRVLVRVNSEMDRVVAAVKTEPYGKRKSAMEAWWEHHRKVRASIVISSEDLWWRFFNGGRINLDVFTTITGDLIAGLLMPTYTDVRLQEDHASVRRKLVQTAVALERSRKAHGKLPAKLADLEPRFLKRVPTDLFSGKPFHYKPSKDGFLLYSVGPNERNEGGKSPDPETFDNDQPDDLAVRVKRP